MMPVRIFAPSAPPGSGHTSVLASTGSMTGGCTAVSAGVGHAAPTPAIPIARAAATRSTKGPRGSGGAGVARRTRRRGRRRRSPREVEPSAWLGSSSEFWVLAASGSSVMAYHLLSGCEHYMATGIDLVW